MLHYHLTGSSTPLRPLARLLLSLLCSEPSISNLPSILEGKHVPSCLSSDNAPVWSLCLLHTHTHTHTYWRACARAPARRCPYIYIYLNIRHLWNKVVGCSEFDLLIHLYIYLWEMEFGVMVHYLMKCMIQRLKKNPYFVERSINQYQNEKTFWILWGKC